MNGDPGTSRARRWPPAPQRRGRLRRGERLFPLPADERGPAGDRRQDAPGATRRPQLPVLPTALPARRADAGALAAAFGVDFLSWDEGDPQRRGRALAPYAVPPAVEERLAATGWSGSGRQRGELALPGTVVPLAQDRALVHVRVRVTPFRRLTGARPGLRDSTDVLPFPAAAPAPADPGWVGLDSYWYELLVPVREVADQWRVDIGAVIVVPPLPADGGVVPP